MAEDLGHDHSGGHSHRILSGPGGKRLGLVARGSSLGVMDGGEGQKKGMPLLGVLNGCCRMPGRLSQEDTGDR